jgi:transglutaminase-like putative cysteine protease
MTVPGEILDHREVDWSRVKRSSCKVQQTFHYTYPGPIHDLRQRLMVVPPDLHGGQRLLRHWVEVSEPMVQARWEQDHFGNRVCHLHIPFVAAEVTFEVLISVERDLAPLPIITDPVYCAALCRPSDLTRPDAALRSVARTLQASGMRGLELVEAINAWVYSQMHYTSEVTDVKTTAQVALQLGKGVCQDYAHIMLVLCRLCGIPARYVSGHMLGEGGTHAWVEVLLPDPGHAGQFLAHAFDPTHNRRPGHTYIVIAVGRDYRDVAPTSGTFHAPYGGHLTTYKHAALVELEHDGGAAA